MQCLQRRYEIARKEEGKKARALTNVAGLNYQLSGAGLDSYFDAIPAFWDTQARLFRLERK